MNDEVQFSISNEHLSTFKVVLDVTNAPDTENPNLPGDMISPRYVIVTAYPEQGAWEVSMLLVSGPKVNQATKKLTKKYYESPYMGPLDPESRTPEWLTRIAQYWQDRLNDMNGKVEKA